ncbi:phosphatase PAP2 family protein [Weissella ceti]|uniref:phosphatase PAP2 family protein n=1 Tax=Weissella ceti TaxID=759620 RepID=UPI001BCAAB09|nr:phosphatase PAP2 family protein [Weissella ceti]QVK11689.1 phosphatase PAP2 family protein [Weissella ceti]
MEFSKTNRRWFVALAGLLILAFLTLFLGVWHNSPFIGRIDAVGYDMIFTGSSLVRTHFAEFISLFGNFIVLSVVVIIMASYMWRKQDKALAQWFAGTFFLVGGVGTLSVKYLVQRPRPAYHLVNEIGFSFPSGHAMLSSTFFWLVAGLTMVYMMRAAHLTMLTGTLVLLTAFAMIALVCWSRVALGVHYLSDVSAGFCLGSAGILLSTSIGHLWWNRHVK